MEHSVDRIQQRWMLNTIDTVSTDSESLVSLAIPSGVDGASVLSHIELEQSHIELEDRADSRLKQRSLEIARQCIGYVRDHDGVVIYAGVDGSGVEHDIIIWDIDVESFELQIDTSFNTELARSNLPDPSNRVELVTERFVDLVDDDDTHVVAGPTGTAEAVAYNDASIVVATPDVVYGRSTGLHNIVHDARSKDIEIVAVPPCMDTYDSIESYSIGALLSIPP